MKFSRIHLVLIVVFIFVACFITVNTKYDEFYRIQGIDNENRILIETYLSDEDKRILIENSYAVDRFLSYITVPGFSMSKLEYYDQVKGADINYTNEEIVEITNRVLEKLSNQNFPNSDYKFSQLVETDMLYGFISSDLFDFHFIDYYQILKKFYNDKDLEFVNDTHQLLNSYTFIKNEVSVESFSSILQQYSYDSLKAYLSNENLYLNYTLLSSINVLNTAIYGDSTLMFYEPINNTIVRVEYLPRMSYFTYLEEEAYSALTKMYSELKETFKKKTLLINRGYEPYNRKEEDYYYNDEFQLGTSIEVFEQGLAPERFEESDLSNWLKENAYRYGYILRYPEGSEDYDPKIYRYVGEEIANEIYQGNISLEEYFIGGHDE